MIKNVVEQYLKIEGEEGDKIREEFEALKSEAIEKARTDFEAEQKKKKPKKGMQ